VKGRDTLFPMSTAAPYDLPRAGDIIAAKYAIVRVLGEGGMGIVYEASHVRLRQRVAIKMLLPEMLAHPILVERFEREARAAAQLRGRHVARVSDVDATVDGTPYMVMEFLEGWDLQREMESRGPLPFAESVDYVLQACAAMAEAHAVGIVHRDLKPSNLFLANDGGIRVVKVLDFGISKVSNDRDVKITDAHAVMGTALYMSPEQVKASHSVDARSDIWALGIILYEAVAGRAPFMGTPTQIAAAIVTEDAPDVRSFAQLPPDLATVLHKTLQRDPSNRFSDVRQLAVALAPFAPPGSIGRVYAESLIGSESGGFRSLVPSPPSSGRALAAAGPDNAPTVMNLAPPPYDASRGASLPPHGSHGSQASQASARSESRMRPDGTSPGWSQHGADTKKNRGLLLGAGVAFVIALVAIGGGLLAMSTSAKKAPVVATSASTAAVVADPVPPALDQPSQPVPPPPTTSTATEATSATAVPAKASPTKGTAKPAAAAPHAPVTAPAPPPAPPSSAAKDKDGKPLFL
jgi:eukaryotic-like serine/threonine-protein kinase